MKTKICSHCKHELATSRFWRDQWNCKKCNRELAAANIARRKAAGLRTASSLTRWRLKYDIFCHYSGGEPHCAICQTAFLEFLSLDHINGGGNAHRKDVVGSDLYGWIKRNDFPAGFRVLCHNCNQSMGAFGYSPAEDPELAMGPPPPPRTFQGTPDDVLAVMNKYSHLPSGEGFKRVAEELGCAVGTVYGYRKRFIKEGRWNTPSERVKNTTGKAT